MNLFKLCRGCMKELETWENLENSIYDMFIFCTKIQSNVEDKLPKIFCSDCRDQIKASYKFITQSLETNITLQNIVSESEAISGDNDNHIKNESSFHFTEKLEVQENDGYYENCMNDDDDLSSNYCEQDIKLETGIDSQRKPRQIIQRLKNTDGRKVGKCKEIEYVQSTQKTTTDTLMQHNYFDVDKSLNQQTTYCEYEVHDLEEIKTENLEKHLQETEDKPLIRNLRKRKKSNKYLNSIELEDRLICAICNKAYPLGKHGNYWLKKHLKQHSEQQERQLTIKEKRKGLCITENTTEEKRINTCLKCKKSFTSKLWFTKHMKKHASTEVHACPFCTKTFVTYAQWVYHKATHEQDKKHVCNVCDKRFRLRKQLAVHAMTHSNERPFICDKCYMGFKMKHVLINHLRVHEKSKPFLCSTCGQGFSTASTLKQHCTVHTRVRPHACNVCGFRTGYSSVLRRHMNRHTHTKRYKCTHCPKEFLEPGGLARHMRIHTGERPYKCPTCPLSFIDGWKRKVHIMRVHQLILEEIPRLTREGRPVAAVIR